MITRIIHTKYGPVRGRVISLDNPELRQVEQYLGIPYASPPVKDLRFMPPNTCDPWEEVRSAEKYAPVCPQKLPYLENEEDVDKMPAGRHKYLNRLAKFLENQSEDCLYLNIYKPAQGKFLFLIVKLAV